MQPPYVKAFLTGIVVWVWVAVLVLLIGALTHSLDSVLALGAHRGTAELWPGPALRAMAIGLIAGLIVAGAILLTDRRPSGEIATQR
jgi:hypothetical protein